MDLHYLEIFNMVAKQESYKKASEILHISQPALSVQIKKLEEQIGLKLFNKIGNKICLSENGSMLYEYTIKIFAIVEDLENNISNQKGFIGGTLNIGGSNTPGTYILPHVIGEFKRIYPNIKFNLIISNTSEIAHLINNGTLDVAVNGGNCTYSNYIFAKKLLDDQLIVVASPKNPCCDKEYIINADLQELSFIVHKTDSQLYTYYKNFIEELNITENISMSLGSIESIKQAVCENLGVSLMPYISVKSELEMGLLKKLNLKQNNFTYPYSLIYNKNKYLSVTAKKFIEILQNSFNDLENNKYFKYRKALIQ